MLSGHILLEKTPEALQSIDNPVKGSFVAHKDKQCDARGQNSYHQKTVGQNMKNVYGRSLDKNTS